jgi:hypothetical protein
MFVWVLFLLDLSIDVLQTVREFRLGGTPSWEALLRVSGFPTASGGECSPAK